MWLPHRSLRTRLGSINALLLLSVSWIILVSWQMQSRWAQAAETVAVVSAAQRANQNIDMLHDGLRGHVMRAFLTGQSGFADGADVRRGLKDDGWEFRSDLATLNELPLPSHVSVQMKSTERACLAYLEEAERLGELALDDRHEALRSIERFDALFEATKVVLAKRTAILVDSADKARAEMQSRSEQAQYWLVLIGGVTVVLSMVVVAMTARSIRRSLRCVSQAASALADGNLDSRVPVQGTDEIGQLARSVNVMADKLQDVIRHMQSDAERGAFGAELTEALVLADTEPRLHGVVARAMQTVSAEHPMELLIADSSRAHLERASEHPRTGAPGCNVESPLSCMAVRRGTKVVFGDSEALNACPHLRGRSSGSVSAMCVPVSFMGGSLGVLHAAGPVDRPLNTEQRARLATLGLQVGNRIGVVRAFAKSQIEASTDALTGLANRRSLEHTMRDLTLAGRPFAFLLADLDHFKRLNDTYGHQAGDDALRLFAAVVRTEIRDGDTAARWGGEEFALVLPNAVATEAIGWVDRVRSALDRRLAKGTLPVFTASFGVADSTMSTQASDLVRLADGALYQSKHAGRNRASVADPAGEKPRPVSEHSASISLSMLAPGA